MSRISVDDDFDDFDDFDDLAEPDEHEEAMLDCSLSADGFCGQAGSEYCEFECPFR